MKSSRLIHIVVGDDAVYVRLFQFLSLLLVDLEPHLVLRISDSHFLLYKSVQQPCINLKNRNRTHCSLEQGRRIKEKGVGGLQKPPGLTDSVNFR